MTTIEIFEAIHRATFSVTADEKSIAAAVAKVRAILSEADGDVREEKSSLNRKEKGGQTRSET